ncbi:hypothetical protein [Clostridium estertheticum]|uniref:hypothetical protein n=1 Tax=Clostridium estertheticum TaxID=238834 RepID=UPI001C0D789B|nr:hypothetical protein [Clostridium estertheticum]MBU3186572.1 hypothetical protein [Clostridium estertheticum]
MEKLEYEYIIVLSLAFPSVNVNFREKDIGNNISEAVGDFDFRFDGRKSIELLEITKQSIVIKLSISFTPKNVTREISAFSQILVQDYNFDKYSAKVGRLFKIVIGSYPEGIEPPGHNRSMYYSGVKEEIMGYMPEVVSKVINNIHQDTSVFIKMSNEILAADNIDKLDNYIQQLENLVSIATNKKDIMVRSKQ